MNQALEATYPERLSFDDAQILRLESAAIKGHTGKISLVEPGADGSPIAVEELRAEVERRLDGAPRCRQRVELDDRGRPQWVDDPEFAITNHVAGVEVEEPVDREAFRAIAAGLMAERLDHQRPLWRLDVVPLQGGGTGIVARIHHCMADGVSALRLGMQILWDLKPGPTEAKRTTTAPPARKKGGKATGSLRTLKALPRALGRELRPQRGKTPLDRHIGDRRDVAFASFELAEAKRIGHAHGHATVNDVVLAAVAGALRGWLQDAGAEPGQLRVQVPVSLHSRDEGAGEIGNRDSFLFVDLPLAEPDPAVRLRRINSETAERKLDHDAETLYSFFHAISCFRPLYSEVTRLASGPREFALSVSNVPGPPGQISVLGRRVAELYTLAEPADRHALRVSVVSLAGSLNFGLCSDPDAIDGLDHLAARLDSAVGELREAVA
jgi:diacylglycerol O-acyltransferase